MTLLWAWGMLAAVALLAGLFFLLTALILRADLRPTAWDIAITSLIQGIPPDPLGSLLIAVSWPGFAPWVWVLNGGIILFLAWRRRHIEALFAAVAGTGGIVAEVVKNLVDRPRPTPDLARVSYELHSYSFPSGHVTGYVCLYGFLLYLAVTLLPRSPLRMAVIALMGTLIVLVGPSRVYMGQHWASDTLAGYALGFAYLLVVIHLYRRSRQG